MPCMCANDSVYEKRKLCMVEIKDRIESNEQKKSSHKIVTCFLVCLSLRSLSCVSIKLTSRLVVISVRLRRQERADIISYQPALFRKK